MRFYHQEEYDAAPETVRAMMADRQFREQVTAAQEAHTSTVDISTVEGVLTVRVDMSRTSDGIPGFARKFVGDDIRIVQCEEWSDASQAGLEVTIPGKPGRLSGTIVLGNGAAGTTTKTVDGTLTVNVPLLGGKLETLVSGLLLKALDQENAVGRSWLAGDR